MNKIIGVTGGVGSGKSMILELLSRKYGFTVIETDAVAKELMENSGPLREALRKALGPEIFGPEGEIQREVYGRLIYSDPEKRRLSDSIVHPAVWKEVEERLKDLQAEGKSAAVETALPGDKLRGLCDTVWYVFCPRPVRMNRLMGDRGYSFEKCLEIMGQQMPEDAYAALSDLVIDNGRDMAFVEQQLHEQLSEKNGGDGERKG